MVQNLIAEISSVQREIAEAQELVNHKKAYRESLTKKLIERVKAGDTSGDRITDMVIQAHNGFNDAFSALYRDSERRLQNKSGETILFTFAERELVRSVFCPTPGFENIYEDVWHVAIGIIEGEHLIRVRRSVELPVSKWATSYLSVSKLVFEKCAHQLNEEWWRVYLEPDVRFASPEPRYELRIGDTEVEAWFKLRNAMPEYYRCCEILDKLVLVPEK